VVSGEGADVWYQRLWRTLEPATMKKSLRKRSVICYRYFVSISPNKL
jgi:hypothetical protein